MRTHCFISTSRGDKGAKWAWHAADEKGVSTKSSAGLFANFNDCVDDARAHGFHHVEVPVLDWSVAPEALPDTAVPQADSGAPEAEPDMPEASEDSTAEH